MRRRRKKKKKKNHLHVCVRPEIAERSKKKIVDLVGKNNDEINTLLRKYARTYLISIQLGGGQHTHLPGVLYRLFYRHF